MNMRKNLERNWNY